VVAPVMASFSSTGPNEITPEILKVCYRIILYSMIGYFDLSVEIVGL